jgi:hypothetical protein
MAEAAIASGADESPLDAGVAGLGVGVELTIAVATGVAVAGVVVAAGWVVESVCAEVSVDDLSEDLPLDLVLPVLPFPAFAADVPALLPELPGLGPLASAGWPVGSVELSALEGDAACVPEEESCDGALLAWLCVCVLAGG